jgi:hypothetical protein
MVPMGNTQHAPWSKRLPVSSRIFFAGAALASSYSIYLDQGIYWLGILTVAAVVLIIFVKRHQRHQDEQYSRFFRKTHEVHPKSQETPAQSR